MNEIAPNLVDFIEHYLTGFTYKEPVSAHDASNRLIINSQYEIGITDKPTDWDCGMQDIAKLVVKELEMRGFKARYGTGQYIFGNKVGF